jgi:hypothetical protein
LLAGLAELALGFENFSAVGEAVQFLRVNEGLAVFAD